MQEQSQIQHSNFGDPAFTSTVTTHFNLAEYNIYDFSVMPIDIVADDINPLCRESFWIHKLQTLHLNGLNSKCVI